MMACEISPEFITEPWSYGILSDGRIFFANDETRTTTWLHPVKNVPVGTGNQTLPDLPKGWERGVTPAGFPYYIDHNKQETTFVHPVTKESLVQTEAIQTPPKQLFRPDDFPRSLHSPVPTLSPTMDGRRASKKKSTNNNLRSPAVKRSSQSPVAMQGWLYKQGSDGLMLWKKRWFVLSDFCLFYYKGPEEDKTLGSILLPSYKISPCTADDRVYRKYAFKAEHHNMRTYYFASETTDTMHMWMNAMSLASILQRNSGATMLRERGEQASVNSLTPNEDEDSGFTSYHSRRQVGSPQHDGNSTLASSYTSESYRYRADGSTSDMSHHMVDGGYLGSADKYPNGYGSVSDYRHPSQAPLKHHAPPKPKRTPADRWADEMENQMPVTVPTPTPRTRYPDWEVVPRKPPQRRTPDPYARTAVLSMGAMPGTNDEHVHRNLKSVQRPHSTELGDFEPSHEYLMREARTLLDAERYDPPNYKETTARSQNECSMQAKNSMYPMSSMGNPDMRSSPCQDSNYNLHKMAHKSKKAAPNSAPQNTSFDSYLTTVQGPHVAPSDNSNVGMRVKDSSHNHHYDHEHEHSQYALQPPSHQHHAIAGEEDDLQCGTDVPRGTNASFLRSASARLPSVSAGTLGPHYRSSREKERDRDRDRDPSGRWSKVPQQMQMLTPSQREASMKRLLEWKRRMLQSPLTKKHVQRNLRAPPIGGTEDGYCNQALLELGNQDAMMYSKGGDASPRSLRDENAHKENSELMSTGKQEDQDVALCPRPAPRPSSKYPLRNLQDPRRVTGAVNCYNSYSSDDEAMDVPERKKNRKSRRNSSEKDAAVSSSKTKRDADYVNLNILGRGDVEQKSLGQEPQKQHLYVNVPPVRKSIMNKKEDVDGMRRRHNSEPDAAFCPRNDEVADDDDIQARNYEVAPQKPKEYQDCWTQTGVSPLPAAPKHENTENYWQPSSTYGYLRQEKLGRDYEDDDVHEARSVEELRSKDRDLHQAYVRNYRKEQERRVSACVSRQTPAVHNLAFPEEIQAIPSEVQTANLEKETPPKKELKNLAEMLKRKESPPKNIVQERIRIFETNSTSSDEKIIRKKVSNSPSSDSGDIKIDGAITPVKEILQETISISRSPTAGTTSESLKAHLVKTEVEELSEKGKGDKEPHYVNFNASPKGGRQDEECYLPMHGAGNIGSGAENGSRMNVNHPSPKSWLHGHHGNEDDSGKSASACRGLTPEEAVYVQMDNQGFLTHYNRGESSPSMCVPSGGYFPGAYCEIGERLRAESESDNLFLMPATPPPPPPLPHEPMYAELTHPLAMAAVSAVKEAPPPLPPQPRPMTVTIPTPRPRIKIPMIQFTEGQNSQSDTSGASDADDEASKELNVPSRFSLSDSYRPASYYLPSSFAKEQQIAPLFSGNTVATPEGSSVEENEGGEAGVVDSSSTGTPPPVPLTPPPPLEDTGPMPLRPLPPPPVSEPWSPLIPAPDLMVSLANVSYNRVYEDDRRLTEFLTRPAPSSPLATLTASTVQIQRDTGSGPGPDPHPIPSQSQSIGMGSSQWTDVNDDSIEQLQNRPRWSPGTAPYYYSDILSATAGVAGSDPSSGLSSPSSSSRGPCLDAPPSSGPSAGTRLRVPLNNSRSAMPIGTMLDIGVGRKVNNIELATSREALGAESIPVTALTPPDQIIRVATELNSSIEYWESRKLAGTERNTYESDTLQRHRANAGALGALSTLELRNIYSGAATEKLTSLGTQTADVTPQAIASSDFGATFAPQYERRSRSLEGLLDIPVVDRRVEESRWTTRGQEAPEPDEPEAGNGAGGDVGGRGDVATTSVRKDDPMAQMSSPSPLLERPLTVSRDRDAEQGFSSTGLFEVGARESVPGSLRDSKRSARGWLSDAPTTSEDPRALHILREVANRPHLTSLATDDVKAGLSFSAGDLLGKTHEELVLLLIQLRRDQTNIELALKRCRMDLDTEQRLLHVDSINREQHIARHKDLLDQHEDLTHQFDLARPLVNLVDNMVKLGALYGAGGNGTGGVPGYEDVEFGDELLDGQLLQQNSVRKPTTSQQGMIEFSRQLQEQRLLQSEKGVWEQPHSAQCNLQDKLENLCKLDQAMQEESSQLFGLQQDKDNLERAIEGLRERAGGCKDDPSQLDRIRRQLWMAENELAKVTTQLSLSSKKLEETAAENIRLENEIMGLRQKVQASLKHHQALGASPLPAETSRMKAQLETELKRITTVMEDLANQRAELCKAMEHVKDRNHELLSHVRPSPTGVAGSAPLPGKKLPRSTYMETDLDTMETHDIVDAKCIPDNNGHNNVIATQIPLYVNSGQLDDHSKESKANADDVDSSFEYLQSETAELYELQDITDADDKMKRFYGILPKEKPAEIKTVRIVKRESERRNKGKDRRKVSYDENSLRKDESDEAETEVYDETDIVDASELDEFQRSMSLPRNYGRFYPPGLAPGFAARPTPPNSLYANTVNRNTPKYYRTPSLSGSDSALSAHERLFGQASPTTTLSIPTFKSEAAKRIVEETAKELAFFDREREVVKEEAGSLKRRHKRRHYTISSSQPVSLETDAANAHKLIHARSRDDLDMERCLRVANTPDVVKSTIKKNDMFDESTIDRELGLPQKIVIPERYVEEEEEVQLTVAERLRRLQKAESIRKMLSEGTVYSDVPSDEVASVTLKKKFEAEKKQREHLLALNQMIAQEVMQKSKAVAANISLERSNN